jgi:hypothetical protein
VRGIIHVTYCSKRGCLVARGTLEELFGSNPEIPGVLLAHLEYWRKKAEGFPFAPPPPKKTP